MFILEPLPPAPEPSVLTNSCFTCVPLNWVGKVLFLTMVCFTVVPPTTSFWILVSLYVVSLTVDPCSITGFTLLSTISFLFIVLIFGFIFITIGWTIFLITGCITTLRSTFSSFIVLCSGIICSWWTSSVFLFFFHNYLMNLIFHHFLL